eukprot:COSAG01_NODE_3085_length_6574_cov_4.675418_5_plen_72_part_00
MPLPYEVWLTSDNYCFFSKISLVTEFYSRQQLLALLHTALLHTHTHVRLFWPVCPFSARSPPFCDGAGQQT